MDMTQRELTACLADLFHDWIDGDDPVKDFQHLPPGTIEVTFESGQQYRVTVEPIIRRREV